MSPPPARTWLLKTGFRLHRTMWWTRAVTLGVRVLVLDGRRIFLVRHTYQPGWFLPGGGVDRGESAEAAAVRELQEEGGLLCTERPVLHGLFRNRGRDHVACFVVRAFEQGPRPRSLEIDDAGFFPVDALPAAASPATRARLAEVLYDQPIRETW